MPWTTEQLRPMMDKLKAGGLKLGNMMIAGFPNTLYAKSGRDEEIAKIKMPDLNCFTVESAIEQVKGACRSMGVEVV